MARKLQSEIETYTAFDLANEDKRNKSPFIIMGAGRSGTSNVARILHEKLNINMGRVFPPPDDVNPDGYYEDIEIWIVNKRFVSGKTTFPQWQSDFVRYVNRRASGGVPWGFKELRTTYFFGFMRPFFDKPKVIRCRRARELVVKSYVEKWGHTDWSANRLYDGRNYVADKLLEGIDHLEIDYSNLRLSDEEIIGAIKIKWPNEFKEG